MGRVKASLGRSILGFVQGAAVSRGVKPSSPRIFDRTLSRAVRPAPFPPRLHDMPPGSNFSRGLSWSPAKNVALPIPACSTPVLRRRVAFDKSSRVMTRPAFSESHGSCRVVSCRVGSGRVGSGQEVFTLLTDPNRHNLRGFTRLVNSPGKNILSLHLAPTGSPPAFLLSSLRR